MNSSAIPDTAAHAAWALDRLAPAGARLGIAVSGGSDSTALLLLAAEWARARGREILCATVDHGLRPEAAAEAEAVGDLCRRLGVAHTTLRWVHDGGAVSQAAARSARRRLLADWASGHDLAAIALGHTADDRIETFLIRVRAGSGWYGLAGPMPSAPSPDRTIRLVRPLLRAHREELRRLVTGRGETWCEDPTNANMRYERVRMRTLATAMSAEARASVLQTMDRLALLRGAVMAQAEAALLASTCEGGRLLLEADRYRGLCAQARLRWLEALVAGTRPYSPPPRRQALVRMDAGLMDGAARGSTLGGLLIRLQGGVVEIGASPPRRSESGETALSGDPSSLRAEAASLLADPAVETLSSGISGSHGLP